MLNSYRVSVCSDENVIEIDSGDGCTTLCMCLMPLNYTLENGSIGKFYVIYISCQILKRAIHPDILPLSSGSLREEFGLNWGNF